MQRIGLIGAGGMGKTHAAAYAAMKNAELVAVCDICDDAAADLAGKYDARAYTSIDTMLNDEDITAVDICTPTPNHLEYIRFAAHAGKHIACEKPLARTGADAEEAAKICEEAGVTLFVAQVLRWFPEFRRLHELIMAGAVGDVVEVRTTRGGKLPSGWDNWFADKARSGGCTFDLIIHDFDWLRWCFGTPTRVYARGLKENGLPERDYSLVTLRFDSDIIAHVEGSWAWYGAFNVSVEVAGSGGLLTYSNQDAAPLVIEKKAVDSVAGSVTLYDSPVARNPYFLELQHFIDCLEKRKKPEVAPEDGVWAVKIAEAALRSIDSGQPVELG